jgi:hypothetical protein
VAAVVHETGRIGLPLEQLIHQPAVAPDDGANLEAESRELVDVAREARFDVQLAIARRGGHHDAVLVAGLLRGRGARGARRQSRGQRGQQRQGGRAGSLRASVVKPLRVVHRCLLAARQRAPAAGRLYRW